MKVPSMSRRLSQRTLSETLPDVNESDGDWNIPVL